MILLEYLRENEVYLSKKGISAMAKAVSDLYPNLNGVFVEHDDAEYWVSKIMVLELPEADCLKILQLTAKYAGLWAFA